MKRLLLIVCAATMAAWAFAAPRLDLPMVENEDAVELPLPPPPSAVPAVPIVPLHNTRAAMPVRPLNVAEASAQKIIQTASADPQIEQMLASVRQDSPRSALETMLYDQLRAALPAGTDGVVLDKASLPSDLKLPAQGWDATFDFHMPARGLGQVPYTATVIGADGRVLRKFSGGVRLDREVQAVQVTRLIRRGEAIQPADLKPLTARLSELDRGAFDNPDLAVGTVARQELRPGRWLTDQMVEVPKIIKRGQPVTIRLARGPIKITTSGVASEAGALGQVIHVKNQSQIERFARVISSDEVQVIF